MDRTRAASDKIRPILEAMERSIDNVRRKRMQESGEVETPMTSTPMPRPEAPRNSTPVETHGTARPVTPPAMIGTPPPAKPEANGEDAPPVRLKAKPKRPSGFTNNAYDQDNYRSQAG